MFGPLKKIYIDDKSDEQQTRKHTIYTTPPPTHWAYTQFSWIISELTTNYNNHPILSTHCIHIQL